MKPPKPVARFFTQSAQARRNVATWKRLGWWGFRTCYLLGQTEAEVTDIIDTYERDRSER